MKKVASIIFSSIILLAAGQVQALDTSGLHSCSDVATPTITGPGPDGDKCHAAILKSVGKFLKTKVGAESKCLSRNEPVLCPDAKGLSKIQKAALKANSSIVKACGDDTAQAALGGFYGGVSDENIIGQCLLGQNAVLADLFLGITHGVPGDILKSSSEKCGKTVAKSAVKYLTGISKATTNCLAKVAVDGATCVGSRVAGAWDDPSDAKAAKGYSKAREKLAKGINKKCSDIPGKQLAEGELGFLISMRSCPGTTTTAGLIDCLSCTSENTWLGILDQVYNESAAAIVAEGESLQDAVDAAATGDKILILSGTYEEEILISAVRKCSGGVDDGVALHPAPAWSTTQTLLRAMVSRSWVAVLPLPVARCCGGLLAWVLLPTVSLPSRSMVLSSRAWSLKTGTRTEFSSAVPKESPSVTLSATVVPRRTRLTESSRYRATT